MVSAWTLPAAAIRLRVERLGDITWAHVMMSLTLRPALQALLG